MSAPVPVLLLPAALVDPTWAGPAAIAAAAATPAWARLARRATPAGEAGPTGPSQDPGHERWLRRRFGLADDESLAAASAHADGARGAAWRLDLVHLHVGRDHLVMTDPAALPEADGVDARALADAVAPLFADDGLALEVPAPGRWYLRETDPARPLRLRTRPLAGALGRNIDAWMPTGDDARRWRRLVNEVQMTWYAHPVNARREAEGRPPFNSLWIEGRVPRAAGEAAVRVATRPRGAADAAPIRVEDAAGPLVVIDALLDAQLAGDPGRWAAAWRALDAGPLSEIAEARGDWSAGARIVLAGDAGWRAIDVPARAGWNVFRRRPDAAALLAEPREAAR